MPTTDQPNNLEPKELLQKAGLTQGMDVGDFGTGGAFFALEAAKIIGQQARVFAVDVLKNALDAAVSKARLAGLNNVIPVWSNLEIFQATRRIPDQKLDFGILVNVLHQAAHPEIILKECARMLKIGGRLLVVEWSQALPGLGPEQGKVLADNQVESLARDAALSRKLNLEPDDNHWAAVFERVG